MDYCAAAFDLFAGLAAAQTSGTGGGACYDLQHSRPGDATIRSEGITELVGDI